MLYVVRHGLTDFENRGRTIGRMDDPLSVEGIEQAKRFADFFEDKKIDLIISSPLTRARETSLIINKKLNVEMEEEQRIIERYMGNYEFKDYPSIKDIVRLWDFEVNTDEENVETMEEFKKRVFSFMDDLSSTSSDKNILLVTHPSVTALIKCYMDNTLYDHVNTRDLRTNQVANYDIKNRKKLSLKNKLK